MFLGVSKVMTAMALVVWFGLALPSVAEAEAFFAGPSDDIEAMINGLEAGDELVLSGGIYNLTERFSFAIAGGKRADRDPRGRG